MKWCNWLHAPIKLIITMFDASVALCLHECTNCFLLNCSAACSNDVLTREPNCFRSNPFGWLVWLMFACHSLSHSTTLILYWCFRYIFFPAAIFKRSCNLHFHSLFFPRLIYQIHFALFRQSKHISYVQSD